MEGDGVRLSGHGVESPYIDTCIICQTTTSQATTSTVNGRKRILDAAYARDDIVKKRLKLIGDSDFVYHMNNECYKKYTLQKTLDKIVSDKIAFDARPAETDTTESPAEDLSRSSRSQSIPRADPSDTSEMYKQTCVICGHIKHKGQYEKYRISESNRAKTFLEATTYLQDEVYTRTCDLQNEHSVFGADLYCHKPCIRTYISKYELASRTPTEQISDKRQAWMHVIEDIQTGLYQGEGYELSHIRDCMNTHMLDSSSCSVTNKEVKVLLINHFGDSIGFSYPKQINKPIMCFSRSITAETMAETIRSTDAVRMCAKMIRDSMREVDFDLQDMFCDANDLQKAWRTMLIPAPLMYFLSIVYDFDVDSFRDTCQGGGENAEDDNSTGRQVSASKCRQMQALFQIMFYNLHHGKKRTPLHILNSQVIYDTCKSATLIKGFNHFGLCSSYDELMRHHNDIASYTVESSTENVPFPSHFDKSQFTIAAFDNFDHDEATLSGIAGSHDTVTVLFQDDTDKQAGKPKVSETNTVHGPKTFHAELQCQELQVVHKPSKKGDLPSNYTVPAEEASASSNLLSTVRGDNWPG